MYKIDRRGRWGGSKNRILGQTPHTIKSNTENRFVMFKPAVGRLRFIKLIPQLVNWT